MKQYVTDNEFNIKIINLMDEIKQMKEIYKNNQSKYKEQNIQVEDHRLKFVSLLDDNHDYITKIRKDKSVI